jgi:hypothetical protein
MTLQHSDSDHEISRYFAALKFVQFLVKVAFGYYLKKKFMNPIKLYIQREELTCNILLQFLDNALELASVVLMVYLGILIKEIEDQHI